MTDYLSSLLLTPVSHHFHMTVHLPKIEIVPRGDFDCHERIRKLTISYTLIPMHMESKRAQREHKAVALECSHVTRTQYKSRFLGTMRQKFAFFLLLGMDAHTTETHRKKATFNPDVLLAPGFQSPSRRHNLTPLISNHFPGIFTAKILGMLTNVALMAKIC